MISAPFWQRATSLSRHVSFPPRLSLSLCSGLPLFLAPFFHRPPRPPPSPGHTHSPSPLISYSGRPSGPPFSLPDNVWSEKNEKPNLCIKIKVSVKAIIYLRVKKNTFPFYRECDLRASSAEGSEKYTRRWSFEEPCFNNNCVAGVRRNG